MALLTGVPPGDLEALADDTTLTRLLKLDQECEIVNDKALPKWASILIVVMIHFLCWIGMIALLIRSRYRMQAITTASMYPTPSQFQLAPSLSVKTLKKTLGNAPPPKEAADFKPAAGSEANVSMASNTPNEDKTDKPKTQVSIHNTAAPTTQTTKTTASKDQQQTTTKKTEALTRTNLMSFSAVSKK